MEELSKPFDEATNFLSSIGSQLTDLCKQTLPSTHTAPAEWEEETSCVEASGDGDLKEMLTRKYSGYLSSLRNELLKKSRLWEMTGLDQKQINNWFINKRKRHWRPSEDDEICPNGRG